MKKNYIFFPQCLLWSTETDPGNGNGKNQQQKQNKNRTRPSQASLLNIYKLKLYSYAGKRR